MKASGYITAILLALLMAVPAAVPAGGSSADLPAGSVLIDMGDGTTYWYDFTEQKGCIELTEQAAGSFGLECTGGSEGFVSIGGMAEHKVGSQTCSWIFYLWNSTESEWESTDISYYTAGSFAWGFYPDGAIVPAETPDSRASWTMHRGDSSSSGVSGSYGTRNAATPLEWYRTYTTGYVDSSIIVAGDRLYHTTGGVYGAMGGDRYPWVYCINRLTGEQLWDYRMEYGRGYEVTSPLVVGDILIVTATCGKVYCFDRFDGTVLHVLDLEEEGKLDYPYTEDGRYAWNGRTFLTGATTPVYDSGAVYFGTSSGHVLAYSVSREAGFTELWDYLPDADFAVDSGGTKTYTGTRGCFYFHAPVIAEENGTRMLYIGSYEGYLYALDASTGDEKWVRQMINLGGSNLPHPGTPGSVGSVTATGDGRLIVACSDGGMSPMTEWIVCVDALTGKGSDGVSEYDWKIEALCGGPVLSGDRFWMYIESSSSGTKELEKTDGTSVELTGQICCFDMDGKVVWSSISSLVKGALTLADGVVYATDYSAGSFWPTGGGVAAYSADTGERLWKMQLSPYSDDSYSMDSVTVIDGKLYVGNDYGAIYCISEVAGRAWGDEGHVEMENGLDWTWGVLAVAAAVCILFLIKFY